MVMGGGRRVALSLDPGGCCETRIDIFPRWTRPFIFVAHLYAGQCSPQQIEGFISY